MKKGFYPLIVMFSIPVLLYSCKKSSDILPAGGGLPVLSTVNVTAITQMSASCGGIITNDGGSAVTFRGVCYGTEPSPTIAGTKTLDGTGTGNFTSSLKGLTDGARYYVRAYATNSNGTAYGEQKVFFALIIGELYQGGKLAYLLKEGDAGFANDVVHGLVATISDQFTSYWDNSATPAETGAKGLELFSGAANTNTVVSKVNTPGIAARRCADLVEGGHDDWYLPSRDELFKLYTAREAIGNFALNTYYWSSSEAGATAAWIQSFSDGVKSTYDKKGSFKVRAVRSF